MLPFGRSLFWSEFKWRLQYRVGILSSILLVAYSVKAARHNYRFSFEDLQEVAPKQHDVPLSEASGMIGHKARVQFRLTGAKLEWV